MIIQTATKLNLLLYNDLPTKTLADRIKKAKLVAGFTQKEMAKLTGLSFSSINELESGYRKNINIDTLKKLLLVLDPNIILDDYLSYILNQGSNIKKLIDKNGINKICEQLKCHRSTVERYRDNKCQIPRYKYERLKELL